MLLLNAELMVEKEAPFLSEEALYKGSVLHGLLERALSDHSPPLWQALRRTQQEKALYALIPPQDSHSSYPAGHRFTVGVMLFGEAVALWHDVLDALMSSRRLGLGKAATPLVVMSASLCHPNHPAQTHLQAVSARNPLPLWKAPVVISSTPEVEGLTVELLSPTQISSQARRQTSLPLTLSSIVKSLQQRLSALEPDLAAQFEFDGAAWKETVRAFWPHQIAARHSTQDLLWFHQSRNTPGPMVKQAVIGSMAFEGTVAGSVVQLLEIGQWLAIGQSCSLGQGWYRLQAEGEVGLKPPSPFDSAFIK